MSNHGRAVNNAGKPAAAEGTLAAARFGAAFAPVTATKAASMEKRRLTPDDFIFGRLLGEGSFSTVFLAKEVSSDKEYAVKVCDKLHIIKEKKQEYIQSEKQILVKLAAEWDEKVPFFVRIHSTFQDSSRLYFVMTYAKNGDLLSFIEKMARHDIDCTQFYAGELLRAVEFLHSKGVIHRDLKPENILLNEKNHILITDFGSAKQLPKGEDSAEDSGAEPVPKRKSFVGTAQYVSPEILNGRGSSRFSDLWAIGCILYQMLTGMPPFQSQSEYLIFQKIQKLEYSFHEGFNENAKDLIQKLLVIEPGDRLGARDPVYYESIRTHPFFDGLSLELLHEATPPAISQYVPPDNLPDPCWTRNPNLVRGVHNLERLMIDEGHLGDDELNKALEGSDEFRNHVLHEVASPKKRRHIVDLTDEERDRLLEEQSKNNRYHKFAEGNLIIKQGILDKKKGLWARRRMFLLTEGPHLYYVDPDNLVLKGEIPWSKTIRPELRDFKIFFVHTPNRVYYLIDPESTAKDWCRAIEEVKQFYFGDES